MITSEQLERRTQRIKAKLKKKKCWKIGYLEEAVDNQLRLMFNSLCNRGDEAQVKFLLRRGVEVPEIINEGRRMQRMIVGGFKSFDETKVKKKKRKKKHRDPKHRRHHSRT